MTNEEAISLLTQVNKILINSNSWLKNTHEPLNIAFDMAIKALKQEPCEDSISRQMAIDAIKKIHPVDTEYNCTLYDKIDVMYVLKNLPSVQPKPKSKTGHWEERSLISDEILVGDRHFLVCSNCNLGVPKGLLGFTNYCPNCGAKMEE